MAAIKHTLLLGLLVSNNLGLVSYADCRTIANRTQDGKVIRKVLADLLNDRDSPLRLWTEMKYKEPIYINFGPFDEIDHESDISGVFTSKQWRVLSSVQRKQLREAIKDTTRRLAGSDYPATIESPDKRLTLEPYQRSKHIRPHNRQPFSIEKQEISIYPPGYSSNGRIAAVYLIYPWSTHWGNALYVLSRVNGNWRIRTHRISIYI